MVVRPGGGRAVCCPQTQPPRSQVWTGLSLQGLMCSRGAQRSLEDLGGPSEAWTGGADRTPKPARSPHGRTWVLSTAAVGNCGDGPRAPSPCCSPFPLSALTGSFSTPSGLCPTGPLQPGILCCGWSPNSPGPYPSQARCVPGQPPAPPRTFPVRLP